VTKQAPGNAADSSRSTRAYGALHFRPLGRASSLRITLRDALSSAHFRRQKWEKSADHSRRIWPSKRTGKTGVAVRRRAAGQAPVCPPGSIAGMHVPVPNAGSDGAPPCDALKVSISKIAVRYFQPASLHGQASSTSKAFRRKVGANSALDHEEACNA